MPRRHRQPQHVGAHARVALGEVAGQVGNDRAQHPLRADHPAQRREPAGVLGVVDPGHDVPVDVLAREPHLDPHPRLGIAANEAGTR